MEIAVLAGGVGAAKILQGLVKLVPPGDLTVIVNTGDDIELHGLHISPDLDIITYTLAGLVDERRGWGIRGDTFNCLGAIEKYGLEAWFKLGDRDLATHIYRTEMLKKGLTLTKATDAIRRRLGVETRIIPMTDSPVTTRIVTGRGILHFQEYLVKYKAVDAVKDVKFEGIEDAKPAFGVIKSIVESDLVVIAPSNPIVSIGTILAVEGIRAALKRSKAKRVAISPIISGAPVKGPADKLMRGLNMTVSSLTVAQMYHNLIDLYVIDIKDQGYRAPLEALGLQALVTNILMRDEESKVQLARDILDSVKRKTLQ